MLEFLGIVRPLTSQIFIIARFCIKLVQTDSLLSKFYWFHDTCTKVSGLLRTVTLRYAMRAVVRLVTDTVRLLMLLCAMFLIS